MLFEDRSLAPYQGTEPYLFLSYSHRNADSAAEAIRWLKAAGFRVWYDEGVIPATEWDENIAQAIENCDYLIALISEAYLSSSNCLDELNYARDRNIPLLLIYLEDVSLPSGLAMRLGRLLAIHRYRYDNPAAFYGKVVRAKGIGICGDGRFEAEEEEEDGTDPDAFWLDEDKEPVRRERPSFFRPFFLILLALVVAGIAFLLLRGWAGERVHGIFGAGESTVTETLPAPDPTSSPPETSAEIELEVTPTPEPSISPEPSPDPSPSTDPTSTPIPTPTPLPSVTPYSDSTVVVVPDSPSPEASATLPPTETIVTEPPTPSTEVPGPGDPSGTEDPPSISSSTEPISTPEAPAESTPPEESASPTPTPTPSPTPVIIG